MTPRQSRGLQLSRSVKVLEDDEDLIAVEVPSSSGQNYLVTIYEDSIRCECPDYQYRNDPSGSFLCKHCYAALHYLNTRHEEEG